MTFCQGNCQGCFFSKEERVSGTLMDTNNFNEVLSNLNLYLKSKNNIKSKKDLDLTVVLGQGDHLSVDKEQLKSFMSQLLILKEFNPLVIFTTSALIKHHDLVDKVEMIREFSRENSIRIVPAVVLDIKKFKHEGFTLKYQENLSFLRESFGILDLVINLGKDTVENLSPVHFVDFINNNKIRHIEFNFVPTIQTLQLFETQTWVAIIDWLSNVAKLKKGTKIFHEYNFMQKMKSRVEDNSFKYLMSLIKESLTSHMYIDSQLNLTPAGFGFVGNAVPYHQKNGHQKNISIRDMKSYEELVDLYAKSALKRYMMDKNCSDCEFLSVCVDSGVDPIRQLVSKDDMAVDCSVNARKLFSVMKQSAEVASQKAVSENITNKDVSAEDSFYGFDEKTDIKY